MAARAATVRDDRAASRYELLLDDELVGELLYRANGEVVALIHTEVASELEGHGLGDRLVSAALEDLRDRGLRVVPLCPFVAAYLRHHPEYESLVEPGRPR
jgi:uncharacterized protein